MKFEQKDYDEIGRGYTNAGVLGYTITLGGKTFVGRNSKKVFKTKQSAMCALNNAIKWRAEEIVKKKLEALGMTRDEINRDAEYRGAYRNFVTQAKADGFLQITEVK